MPLTAGQADLFSVLALAVGVLAMALLVFRASIRIGFVVWMLVIAFVPVWFSVPLFVNWPPGTVVGVLLLLGGIPWGERRIGIADAFTAAFFVACMMPILVPGGWTPASIFVPIAQWALAFTLGRLLPARIGQEWIYAVVAIVMTAVAALAVIEFFLHWNPFASLPSPWSGQRAWSQLQVRGGITRAEGAFGHSIALGCSLALAVPLALGSRLRISLRAIMVFVLLLGAVVSFSRLGMVCAAIGLLLSLLLIPGLTTRTRLLAIGAAFVAGLTLVPLVLQVFAQASEETTRSAGYRLQLLSLMPKIAFLGFSDASSRDAAGVHSFDQFKSIDSALMLTGLMYGWFALLLAFVLLAMTLIALLAGRAAPPTVAVVAQIPALMTVALITQYAMVFWFVAGLAAAAQVDARRARNVLEPPASPPARISPLAPHLSAID